MKIQLNPLFVELKDFVSGIPDFFATSGELIYNHRNQLRVFTVGEYDIVVKSFKKPHLINRIAYTFFRPSKARRSYEYAIRLLDAGISTPLPIAYIENTCCGLLSNSYYISVFERKFKHIRDEMQGINADDFFIEQFGNFIARLHQKGVWFLDLSPGNVLIQRHTDCIDFTLVDINRMKFLPEISMKKRLRNFRRLTDDIQILSKLAHVYAKKCGYNPIEVEATILKNVKYIEK